MHPGFSPFPVLITARLVLRKVKLSDKNEVFFLRSDPRVMEYLTTPVAGSMADATAYIRKINGGTPAGEWLWWGMALNKKGPLIGSICLWNFNDERTEAEVGYVLHPQEQGKGLMQEALEAVLHYGFNRLKLQKTWAFIHPGNKKSVQLLERNHFTYERQSGEMVVFSVSNMVYKKNICLHRSPKHNI